MRRRVYVMDCGDFVKIGVSNNVDRRKGQIDYEVKQYYSTEPLDNAFEIEKYMHSAFEPVRKTEANGREYFNIDFETARMFLEQSVIAKPRHRMQIVKSIQNIFTKTKEKTMFNSQFYEFITQIINMQTSDLAFLSYAAKGLLLRQEINAHSQQTRR